MQLARGDMSQKNVTITVQAGTNGIAVPNGSVSSREQIELLALPHPAHRTAYPPCF